MRAVLLALVLSSSSAVLADPLAGEVLVWQDAPLLIDAAGKESIQIAKLTKPRDKSTGHVFQMRVVADHGELVEVEDTSSTCDPFGSLYVDARLDKARFFVRKTDLAPVLVKPWSETYKDGTRIALEPGVPVSAGKQRTIALSIGGGKAPVALAVKIPDESIGFAFTPTPEARSTQYTRPGEWEITTRTVTLGGKPITLDHALPLFVDEPPVEGKRAKLAFDFGCESLDVTVAKNQVRRFKSKGLFGGLLGAEMQPPRSGKIIPKSTALATKSGTRVAVARHDFVATDPCNDFALRVERRVGKHSEATLRLCAPASAMKEQPPPPSLTGTGGAADEPPRKRNATASVGDVTSSGGLHGEVIQRVIRGETSKLAACFEAVADAKPGTLSVRLTIGTDGRPTSASASGIAGVETCVADTMKRIAFPKPTGVTMAEVPVTLRWSRY